MLLIRQLTWKRDLWLLAPVEDSGNSKLLYSYSQVVQDKQ